MALHLRPDLRELQGEMCFVYSWARDRTARDSDCQGSCCTISWWSRQGLDCEALICACSACLYRQLDMRGVVRR